MFFTISHVCFLHNTYRCEKTPDLGKNPPIEYKKQPAHFG